MSIRGIPLRNAIAVDLVFLRSLAPDTAPVRGLSGPWINRSRLTVALAFMLLLAAA